MKKIYIILALLIVFKNGVAQITLEQVNSDSSVAAFVKQKNYSKDAPQWNHFYLTTGDEWKYYFNFDKQKESEIAAFLPNHSWMKIDLNHDGKEDLVVGGYISKSPKANAEAAFKLLVFLSTIKENVYDEIDLTNDATDNFPVYFDMATVNKQNYLRLYRWYFQKDSVPSMPDADTLQYNSFVKNFVNYAETLYPSGIRKIDYHVKDDEAGSYHNIVIEKTQDNKMLIHVSQVQSSDKNPQIHSLKIKEDLFNNIDSLARQLNLASDSVVLKEEAEGESLPVNVSIYYTDGTKKTITDYGQTDNYTLLAIYETLENAMDAVLQRLQRRSEFWGGVGGVLGEVGADLL